MSKYIFDFGKGKWQAELDLKFCTNQWDCALAIALWRLRFGDSLGKACFSSLLGLWFLYLSKVSSLLFSFALRCGCHMWFSILACPGYNRWFSLKRNAWVLELFSKLLLIDARERSCQCRFICWIHSFSGPVWVLLSSAAGISWLVWSVLKLQLKCLLWVLWKLVGVHERVHEELYLFVRCRLRFCYGMIGKAFVVYRFVIWAISLCCFLRWRWASVSMELLYKSFQACVEQLLPTTHAASLLNLCCNYFWVWVFVPLCF